MEETRRAVHQVRNWQECFAWNRLDLPAGVGQTTPLSFGFDYADLTVPVGFDNLNCSIESEEACGENFGLRLSARNTVSGLTLEFHYAASFDAQTAEQWIDSFTTLLAAAISGEATEACRLPLLSALEHQRLLITLNQTAAAFPRTFCIHQLFEQQAARTPNRVAVRCEENILTYGELNELANRLASTLRREGVVQNSLVGLCLERSVDMILALLAILKAGGACLPLSPGHPKARLAQQLAGAAALITASLLPQLPEFGFPTICLGRDRAKWMEEPAENRDLGHDPESLAYVIHTSGSPGTPKGVGVRHRN